MAMNEQTRLPDEGKFEITVNDKLVVLEGTQQTGTSVKRAAIHQGVKIRMDFQLTVELPDGRARSVGDSEEIAIHNGERFVSIKSDGRVEVMVNNKPVTLEGARQTGSNLKRAAIRQGVEIAMDFLLIVEPFDGQKRVVRNDEEIVVHDGLRFISIEKDKRVEVTVNDHPVVLEGVRQTGLSVKRAAIQQNVQIEESFVLSIELGGGRTKLVGDEEEIVVQNGERFLAIENDDNS